MSKKPVSKGNANKETLGDRLKAYENVQTERMLIARLPTYVRIDGRAFHTFCHGLIKPFDPVFVEIMKKTCAYLVEKTNAMCGYVQSDEISLAYESPEKMPFECRVFKIESSYAAMATSAFTLFGLETKLGEKIKKMMPTFDCRVFQVPSMSELANCFVWREQDCLKNSITTVALSKFGHSKLQNKNGDEKIKMLKKEFDYDFYKDTPIDFVRGSYFRREPYMKELTEAEVSKISEKNRQTLRRVRSSAGDEIRCAVRTHIVQFYPVFPLAKAEDKASEIFSKEGSL